MPSDWTEDRADEVRSTLFLGSDANYTPTELPPSIGEALTVALKPYRRFTNGQVNVDLYVLADYTIWYYDGGHGRYVLGGISEQEAMYDRLDDDGFHEIDGNSTSAVQAHDSLKIPYGGRD